MIDTGLDPVIAPGARLLVLGSMPGRRSLDAQRYYAHPRNLFWPLMAELAGFDAALAYPQRLEALASAGVALWDVLAACERPGSLDAAIVRHSERPNPIGGLLARHASIRAVACNGAAALQLYRRHVAPTLPAAVAGRTDLVGLPSTSPANASIPLERKRAAWLELRAYLGPAGAPSVEGVE